MVILIKTRLENAILFYRPDLQGVFDHSKSSNEKEVIPLNPPINFFQELEVPEIGKLMLASFPRDHYFYSDFKSKHWWMGEKYDGIRCCYNAAHNNFYGRNGEMIKMPFVMLRESPPSRVIDGELWFGRGSYSDTKSLFNGSYDLYHLSLLRFVAFDIPEYSSMRNTYEMRYIHLINSIPHSNLWIITAPRILCENSSHLQKAFQSLITESGEGVILQKVGSYYVTARTEELIKVKTEMKSDREGIVMRVEDDYSVWLRLPEGREIKVQGENVQITTPEIGAIVTFSYETSASRIATPRNPTIFRIRTDLTWEDVVAQFTKDKKYLSGISHMKGTSQEPNQWTKKSMRSFMESFAKRRNLDPLSPSTWYNLYSPFMKTRIGKKICSKFKGGFLRALQHLFSDVKFDNQAFHRSIWTDVSDRRKFFEKFAFDNGFDPLVSDNWYSQSKDQIMATKGAKRVIEYHKQSVAKALIDLFPDIGLEKLHLHTNNSWINPEARRNFFIGFAKEYNFDPLVPSDWYKQNKELIYQHKGSRGVLSYYGKSIAMALLELFPEIGLEKSKLYKKSQVHKKQVRF